MNRRGRRQRGFTLVELLVTMVISVFALMGLLALHGSLSQSTTRSGQFQEAVAVGSNVLETLRKVRPGDLSTRVTGSSAIPPYTNATYGPVLGRNGISYSVGVSVTSPANELWLMRVEVTWTSERDGGTTMLPLELIRPAREAL
jgi:prepilin-type N-terminal cleavage/methylation domain-containing protein